QRHEHRVQAMCRVLGVARSGFYAWCRNKAARAAREERQQAFDGQVQEAFEDSRQRSGAPRLTRELDGQGVSANRKTVARSMRRQGLRARTTRRFKVTTNSAHSLPVAPNHLAQCFEAQQRNQKWTGDITYLATGEGWLYLAVVLDLCGRKVIGWAMRDQMSAELACEALQMALERRGHPTGVIVHTDRGSQYCSRAYRRLISDYGLISSMSAKGSCYDNACNESFFRSLKVEALHGESFPTRASMRQAVFEYIEGYYNRRRLHSTLGYLSPDDYEARLNS
ncbi:MAG: IS3 family transposase, partial [Halorhodospira sp.]